MIVESMFSAMVDLANDHGESWRGWDERDVFWIDKSASAADMRAVLTLLKTYDGR